MWVETAVENTLYHFDKPFTYSVPHELEAEIKLGVRVLVPFGRGNIGRVGLVLSVSENAEEKPNAAMKSILQLLDKVPVLDAEMIQLVFWLRERYFCTLFEAAKLMIPAGFGYRLKNSYILKDGFENLENYSGIQKQVLSLLYETVKSVPFDVVAKTLGITESCPEFVDLLQKGIILRVNKASTKIKDAFSKMVRAVPDFSGKLSPRQAELYQTLLEVGTVSEKEICYFTGASMAVLKALAEKGAAERFGYEVYRRPEMGECEQINSDICLSPEQQQAYDGLKSEFDKEKSACALLYGVTGSGKTSVFMKLMQHVYAMGRGIIVMVPEISLTTQTIRQFSALFGEAVAVFHSKLSLGERLDEWKRVKRGEAKIVVGTRSAVFAPIQNLGLIVMDEEQEHTYKSESAPRYDAREVAIKRCAENKGLCLFSSATPSIESYYATQTGRFSLYKLTSRFGEAEMPEVALIDLNKEEMATAGTLISPTLSACLQENFDKHKQSIILLNRRGYHTFIACKECGEVASCPHCSISLTYHAANGRLMCHYCGYSVKFKDICPSCGSEYVQFRGSGTQKAEEELAKCLPDAKILRIDTDSTAGKYSLENKLDEFRKGDYDVMVGTQMVAKGLDFENVTLVGVLSADLMLFSDDFRSNEQTFDLLTQVVGRAGRRSSKGEALIQTYYPENEYLALAAQQDYEGFYEAEIAFRKALLYPPFVDICVTGFTGINEKRVRQAAQRFLQTLSELAKEQYPSLPLRVLQPAPAAVAKVSEKYRYKILIKCKNTVKFREMMTNLLKNFALDKKNTGVTVYAATNPYHVL
ncbi:replication restart helicase PriA [Scatolibacter rhodanostii]|uniref:replication restart helicase PriA n=1 Tax=Scatolibacter rhodanostii TaxID=2014781 RepID=UPI000C06AF39|nr:primosomal protein N' [Scatolibacter rhodanostii]